MVDGALAKKGETTRAVERWKEEMPREEEMVPKDKYTIFDRKERKYRKGIHSEFTPLDDQRLSWGIVVSIIWVWANNWVCRVTEMDESISTSQSPRLLRIRRAVEERRRDGCDGCIPRL